MKTNRKTSLTVIVVGLLLTVGIFLADVLLLPLGVAAGVPYVSVVLISLWLPRRWHTICVAVAVSGLTLLGIYWSEPAGIQWMVAANRLLALLVIWVTATLGLAQRRAKELSQQSEARLDAFFTDAPAGLAILDAQSVYTKVNDSLARTNGMAAIDHVGKRPGEITDGMGQRLEERCRQVLETGQSILNLQTDGEVLGRPGTTSHFVSSAFPLAGANGKPVAVGCIVVDVTERKQAEELLRRREHELRLITDNVPALISYVDAEQRFRFVNPGYEKWFGLPRETIIGMHVKDLLGEKTYGPIRPNIELALTGRQVSFETTVHLNDDDVHWAHGTYVPDVGAEGNVKGFYVLVNDITARKRAEAELKRLNETLERRVVERTAELTASNEALRESEARFRQLAENIPEAFWLFTADRSKVLYVSPAYETIWGRKAADLYADPESRFEAIHPDDRGKILRERDLQRRGIFKDHYAHELRIIRPDGTVRWIWSRCVSIRDEQGNVHRIAGVATDITDRKGAEEAFRKSEAQQRALLDAIPDMMFRFDRSGTFLDFRGDRDELLMVPDDVIGGNLHRSPMPGGVVQTIMNAANKALDSGTVQCAEYSLRKKNVLRHYEARIVGSGDDECVAIVGDVTERQQMEQALRASEQRYAKAAKIAKFGYWERDLDEDTAVWSDETCRIFGVESNHFDANSGDYSSLVHPDDRDRVMNMQSAAASSGQPLDIHYRICRPDGTDRVIHSVAEPRRDPGGRVVGLVGTVHDVTDRRELEKEVLGIAAGEQRRIGQDLHDGLGQELTGLALMAHDLREKLDEKSLPEGQSAGRISAGIKSALKQVRTLSRGLVPVEVDAQGLYSALTQLAATASEASGISCTLECAQPDQPLDNDAATHLYRIAQEAVTNALKHSRADHVRISLEASGNHSVLKIRDNGHGIEEPRQASEGLGLRIMGYRADLIGAKLRVGPADGQGTQVTCTLPFGSNNGQGLGSTNGKGR